MFESKDKDLDGRLSFEEFMGEASRAEKLFKLMDKDGDGTITKEVDKMNFFLMIILIHSLPSLKGVPPHC